MFNFSCYFLFPLILMLLLYTPKSQWGSPGLQTSFYWAVLTVVAVGAYYLGNRLLAYTIGDARFSAKQLHKINVIVIYGYLAIFLVSVYLVR